MSAQRRDSRLTEDQRRAVRRFGLRVALLVFALFAATIVYVTFFAKHFMNLEKVRQWHM